MIDYKQIRKDVEAILKMMESGNYTDFNIYINQEGVQSYDFGPTEDQKARFLREFSL